MIAVRPVCLRPRRLSLLLALYRLSRPAPYGLGYPPSIRELTGSLGLSAFSWIGYNLQRLVEDGLVLGPADKEGRVWRVNHDRLMFRTEAGVTSAWRYV